LSPSNSPRSRSALAAFPVAKSNVKGLVLSLGKWLRPTELAVKHSGAHMDGGGPTMRAVARILRPLQLP
jgi:hypothetical protein